MNEVDAVVVGAGNAALTAAIAAAEGGIRVLVLEKADRSERGGNTWFTGPGFRAAYDSPSEIFGLLPDPSAAKDLSASPYPEDDFYADIMQVTDGRADPTLARQIVRESLPTLYWLRSHGVRFAPHFQPGISITTGSKTIWPHGATPIAGEGRGRDWSDRLFEIAANLGVEIWYESECTGLIQDDDGQIAGVRAVSEGGATRDIASKSVILACGGFEANPEMRENHLGSEWRSVKVRGIRHNTGDGLRLALDAGANPAGDWSGCHATCIAAEASEFGQRDRSVAIHGTSRTSFNLGIMLNIMGNRFVDEGRDIIELTYAAMGRAILREPAALAFQVFDQKTKEMLQDRYFQSDSLFYADSLAELGTKISEVAARAAERHSLTFSANRTQKQVVATVESFNSAVLDREFIPQVLDGKGTTGVEPAKSNWAVTIDSPPYICAPVTCGITFAFGGVQINESAAVLDTRGLPIPGLFAAGEMVGFWHNSYPGGAGLVAGAVFGKIAGESAARA